MTPPVRILIDYAVTTHWPGTHLLTFQVRVHCFGTLVNQKYISVFEVAWSNSCVSKLLRHALVAVDDASSNCLYTSLPTVSPYVTRMLIVLIREHRLLSSQFKQRHSVRAIVYSIPHCLLYNFHINFTFQFYSLFLLPWCLPLFTSGQHTSTFAIVKIAYD